MMLKTFFLSQVAHAIALPENVPGDISYKMDSGVTGMAPPSGNILRYSADAHRIERELVGRRSLASKNGGYPYQSALERSVWAKVAVLGSVVLDLINLFSYLTNITTALPVKLAMGAVGLLFYLTTLFFTFKYAKGWFWRNAAIHVGAVIPSVGLGYYVCRTMFDGIDFFGSTSNEQILIQLQLNIQGKENTFLGSVTIFAISLLTLFISGIVHNVRGIIIPTFFLLF